MPSMLSAWCLSKFSNRKSKMCGIFNTRNIICAMNVQVQNKVTFRIPLVADSFYELLDPDSNETPTQTHVQRHCKLPSIIRCAKKQNKNKTWVNIRDERWSLFHIGASSSYRNMAYIVHFSACSLTSDYSKSV